jgi:PAS domain S-box-containing protein
MADPQARPMGAGRDLWAKRKDGSDVPVEIGLSPIETADGTLVLASIVDISERKRAEQAFRESEERLNAFLRHLPGAAWIKDLEGRYLYANPEGERIFGIPLEQLRGKTDEDIFPPRTARQFRENDRRVLAEGESVETTEILCQPDGAEHHSIVSKFVLPGAGGRPACIAGVAFDITDRKRAEEALRQSEERLRLAQQASRIGTYEWDIQSNVSTWTPEMEALHGLPPGGFAGTYAAWEQLVHPEDRPEAARQLERAIAEGAFEGEWRVVWPNGTVRWLAARGSVFKDENGKPLRMIGVDIDITERKDAEEEVKAAQRSAERAKAAAEQANRTKDHFLAVLSHELRTPLTPVVMAVSLLQVKQDLDPTMRETLEMIGRNVEMEARLIDDLLDVSRIERGKIELQKQRVALCSVIQRAVEVCKLDIEARELHFGVDRGATAPYWIEADVPRLQQVFWNLLKNAVKFTPHGGCVGVRCRPNEKYVVAEVNDSGMGIEPEAISRVFNAFEQAERSITRRFGGLGLWDWRSARPSSRCTGAQSPPIATAATKVRRSASDCRSLRPSAGPKCLHLPQPRRAPCAPCASSWWRTTASPRK